MDPDTGDKVVFYLSLIALGFLIGLMACGAI